MGVLGNFREVVKNMKHRRPCTRVCPRCGSPDLRLSSRFDMWLLPEQYFCGNCGYKGPIVMEVEKAETEKNTDTSLEAADQADATDSCSDS